MIFTHAGGDCTDIFKAFHAVGSDKVMGKFLIGEVDGNASPKKDSKQLAFEKGYRELGLHLHTLGLFKSSKAFYFYKCISTFSLLAVAAALVYHFHESTVITITSALILGLFWQQSGWLAHDFLHHQVFPQRRYGDYAGLVWGNLLQGTWVPF